MIDDSKEKKDMIKADFYLTKHYLLTSLLDMESLYFNGLWGQIMGRPAKTIKTLLHEN